MPTCNTLGDEDLGRTADSIGAGAGLPACQLVCLGLGVAADSRRARECVWKRAGESVSGDTAEGQQGGVRLHGHRPGDLQPVSFSAARASGVLVA